MEDGQRIDPIVLAGSRDPFEWQPGSIEQIRVTHMFKEAGTVTGVAERKDSFLMWGPWPYPHPHVHVAFAITHDAVAEKKMTYDEVGDYLDTDAFGLQPRLFIHKDRASVYHVIFRYRADFFDVVRDLLSEGIHELGPPRWVYFKAWSYQLPMGPCSLFLQTRETIRHLDPGDSLCDWNRCHFHIDAILVTNEDVATVVGGDINDIPDGF